MSERGIDVFETYQGAIDWGQVASSGVRHALIKLTNGASVASPPGDRYVTGARAAGLRTGGYAYALGGDPVTQANCFADELLRLNNLGNAPALDYEDDSLPADPSAARAWIVSFFTQLRRRIDALSRVLLYSSGSKLVHIGAGAVTVPGLEVLIWNAEYGPNDGTEHPMRYYTGPVAIHQHSSAGRVPGIAVNVDVNTVYDDISASGGTQPTTTEDDMTTAPAGTDEHLDVIVAGKTKLYLACSFGQTIDVTSIDFFGDTGASPTGTGVGGAFGGFRLEPNRPGPLAIPRGAAMATIRYTAKHSFGVGTI